MNGVVFVKIFLILPGKKITETPLGIRGIFLFGGELVDINDLVSELNRKQNGGALLLGWSIVWRFYLF